MNRKKRLSLLLIGIIAFLILFYQQYPGVNCSILAFITWGLIHFSIRKKQKDRIYRLLSIAVLLTSLGQAWYGDSFTFFALFLSLCTLGIYVQYPRINFVLYPVIVFLSYLTFPVRFFIFKFWISGKDLGHTFLKKLVAWVLIPVIFSFIFIVIYTTGSSLFQDFFSKFHFHFFEFIFLLIAGFIFYFNFWFLFIPKGFIKCNQQMGDKFSIKKQTGQSPSFAFLDLEFERNSGTITLILLNLFLLIFIIAYNYEQFFITPDIGNLSKEIHDRVTTIIVSIVMAIVVILFYFKSTFNFDKKAGILRKLSYIWLFLNGLLVISAFMKNSEYIFNYGLTFKRIGVCIFLVLCLTGLLYSCLKIKNRRTNTYLINRMFRAFFGTFIICSLINFSWIVTKYNLSFNENIDIAYLQSLTYNKQILYNHFKDTDSWDDFLYLQKENVRDEREKSVLSSHLYYYFLDMDYK